MTTEKHPILAQKDRQDALIEVVLDAENSMIKGLAQCKSTANQNRLIAEELRQIKEQQKKLFNDFQKVKPIGFIEKMASLFIEQYGQNRFAMIVSNIIVAIIVISLLSIVSLFKDDNLEQQVLDNIVIQKYQKEIYIKTKNSKDWQEL